LDTLSNTISPMFEAYKAIHQLVLQTHIGWAQFRFLFTVSDRRMTVLSNTAPGFFAVLREVLRNEAFMGIRRLTDPAETRGKRNLSLRTLVKFADASHNSQLSSQANSKMTELLSRAKTIRDVGDVWIAHTDLVRALSETPLGDLKVQRGEVDEVLGLIRELMWLFADYLSEARVNYDLPIIVGDADVLARFLEDATDAP
jgi:hypothetical protein